MITHLFPLRSPPRPAPSSVGFVVKTRLDQLIHHLLWNAPPLANLDFDGVAEVAGRHRAAWVERAVAGAIAGWPPPLWSTLQLE